MLKKIFLVIFWGLINFSIAQEQPECATQVPPGVSAVDLASGNLTLYKRTSFVNLRLALHIVRKSDGSQGIDISLMNQMIQKLNELFTPVMFNFSVYSVDTLDSDYFANVSVDDSTKMNNLKRLKNIAGCINIYFIPFMNAYGISSFSPRFYQGGYRDEQGILISNQAHLTTLAHEMGHYFDLLHPFETALNPREEPGMPPLEYENIAREGNCANWWRTGDLLKDTPADPYWYGNYVINTNCIIEITKPFPLDGCGQRNYNPLTDNIMHTSRKECRYYFTQDQKARMNETLMLYRMDLLEHIVYLENRYRGENAGGSLHVNDRHYPSGTYITLSSGEYRIGTDDERFPNWKNRGFTIKHNNWNKVRSDYLLSRYVTIDSSQQQIAEYEKLEYAKVGIFLENQIIPSKGSGKFQDPWYVLSDGSQPGNYWINFLSIYEPTGKEGAQEKGVFLDQGLPRWQPPYYSVKADAVQDIYLPHTDRTHKFYFQGWSATPEGSAEFQNANALETPVIFKQSGALVSAKYKGSMLSNSVNALSSSSQRKVVRTQNGNLHIVYESMGKLWYQKSTNNGTNWSAPKIIEPGLNVKSFSIDYVQNKIYLIAQYEEENESRIFLYQIDENGNVSAFPDGIHNTLPVANNSVEAFPLVAANYENILFIWKESNEGPLKLVRFHWDGENWERSDIRIIPNTTGNSINPSISLVKSFYCSKVYSHLVWEEKEDESRSQLLYTRVMFERDYLNDISFENFSKVSNGSGYEVTTKPTIVEDGENGALIGFIGIKRYETEDLSLDRVEAVLTTIPSRNIFYSYSEDVLSVNINKCNSRWVFAWTRGNNLPIQYVDSRDIRVIYQLGNMKGVDVQISNGVLPEDMYAFTINTSIAPYPINFRAIYGEILPEELVVTEEEREGIVNKEGGSIYYSFGKIKEDNNEKVKMTEIPDSIDITTLEDANRYLYSKPFIVNDNSGFVYSIRYGVTDSSSLKEALGSNEYVRFRVELIDANTKEILGVFDEVTYNSQNLSKYENIDYYVNTSGLGERMVQLRLVISNNIDPYYSLLDKKLDESYNIQKKRARKEIGYKGILGIEVTDFSLHQNYPNPFNPATKIRYSLKERGLVTIRIYDVLGRELITLVNEEKERGEYEIEFDASRFGLSSGIYLYELRSGSFRGIKKFVLTK